MLRLSFPNLYPPSACLRARLQISDRRLAMSAQAGYFAGGRNEEDSHQPTLHVATTGAAGGPVHRGSFSDTDSSNGSAHPLHHTLEHAAGQLPFPSGPHGDMYSDVSSSAHSRPPASSQTHTSQDKFRAVAWLYDYDGSAEADDWLHVPGVERKKRLSEKLCGCCNISFLGFLNLATLALISCSLMMLFAGYPILQFFRKADADRKAKTFFGLGGTNGTGQVPLLPGLFSLIDQDTPEKAYSWKHPIDGGEFHLVFSDEFNQDGRTFWPGDDPFWEAVDLHYWVTGDFEWYSPEAVNTSSGFLNVWMQEHETHNLNFRSGMLQSWNKFCFQGGYLETSAVLPGSHDTEGFWPAVWTLGNLGRAGYAGTTQGMWPYSYNQCDVGTLANQTNPEKTAPHSALHTYTPYDQNGPGKKISYLEGQRTSACTCPGEDHPGPSHDIGRSSPEIDVFEAQTYMGHGSASQSFQIAPFDANYSWSQAPEVAHLYSPDATFNTYTGGIYQEAVSAIARVPDTAYDQSGGVPVRFGMQWDPDWDGDGSGSITWFVDGKATWSVTGHALGPNPYTEIGQRLIPTEPVSIIINLAMSDGFQAVKWNQVQFPAVMKIDYVRVYQRDGQPDRISCDPPDHPTAKYIQDHLDVYMNNNYTVFPQDKYG
ncbi:hypothetical protein PANT_19d00031 [Moesziomyces antarcticus T-34]|uniref:GH16 domain-containing protein n=1 Tax=Pseudozyma antarctica (strain T-34) TaxID=1151754 RepID=M9LYP0_PSEA3|nr:hypothetical protein PANT_19d00031 [Moesziomyces antarcticus T-34]